MCDDFIGSFFDPFLGIAVGYFPQFPDWNHRSPRGDLPQDRLQTERDPRRSDGQVHQGTRIPHWGQMSCGRFQQLKWRCWKMGIYVYIYIHVYTPAHIYMYIYIYLRGANSIKTLSCLPFQATARHRVCAYIHIYIYNAIRVYYIYIYTYTYYH